jgi:hypothetical protein
VIGLDTNGLARYFVVETDADAANESERQSAAAGWGQGRAAGRRPFGTRQPSPGPLTVQASSQGKADQGRVTLASPCPQKLTVLAEGSTVIL